MELRNFNTLIRLPPKINSYTSVNSYLSGNLLSARPAASCLPHLLPFNFTFLLQCPSLYVSGLPVSRTSRQRAQVAPSLLPMARLVSILYPAPIIYLILGSPSSNPVTSTSSLFCSFLTTPSIFSFSWLLVLLPLPYVLPFLTLHSFKLALPSSHTGKAPVTPLAEPPAPEKDAQNKTEQLGELFIWSISTLSLPPAPHPLPHPDNF